MATTEKIVTDVATIKTTLAAVLKRARELSGKTQSELATILETSQGNISTAESGQTLSNLITLDRWMQGCGTELHFVVTKKGESLESLGITEAK